MSQTGIYEIVNDITGHRYVGQSVDIERRWKQHLYHLGRGKSVHSRLQREWNKYGRPAFTFKIIGECILDKVALNFFENVALKALPHEFNTCEAAESVLGIKRTPEQNAAKSERMKGIKYPPRKPEQCVQIAGRMKGNKYGVGIQTWLGKKHTPEARAKMSAAKLGKRFKRGPMSPEHKAAISAALIRRRNALCV